MIRHYFPLVIACFCFYPAISFAAEQDAAAKLRENLRSTSTEIVCGAAEKLGNMQDQDAVSLLAGLAESTDRDIRKCSVEALGLYGEQGFCQDFFTIWLTDKDDDVRRAAGISVIENECENHIERSTKYGMDSKTCGYTQFFLNTVRDAVAETPAGEDWKKPIAKISVRETIVDADTPEEIINMRLNLVYAIIDWGESVAALRGLKDHGSMAANRKSHILKLEEYRLKEEFVKQFCPNSLFPAFTFWNQMIEKQQ